ncbi:hypothetical protein [Pseudomonas ovata]|uniref:hypothetical protein n=1 Tax=Pseudomonas ovata TaxID=1839709 RepID=UPI000D692190|nr:hypothetical protein [Pseudomonas ovata]
MKLPSRSALLSCLILAAPLGAQAAMDSTTRSDFTEQCVSAAKQQKLDDKSAKAHCECGAKQIDANFSDKEIAAMNNASAAPDPALASKLQKLVAQHCVK